eukprot:gene14403-biopygen21639
MCGALFQKCGASAGHVFFQKCEASGGTPLEMCGGCAGGNDEWKVPGNAIPLPCLFRSKPGNVRVSSDRDAVCVRSLCREVERPDSEVQRWEGGLPRRGGGGETHRRALGISRSPYPPLPPEKKGGYVALVEVPVPTVFAEVGTCTLYRGGYGDLGGSTYPPLPTYPPGRRTYNCRSPRFGSVPLRCVLFCHDLLRFLLFCCFVLLYLLILHRDPVPRRRRYFAGAGASLGQKWSSGRRVRTEMFPPPVGEHGTRVVTSGRGARSGCCYLQSGSADRDVVTSGRRSQKCSQLRSGSADRNFVTSGRGPVLRRGGNFAGTSPAPVLRRGGNFAGAGTSAGPVLRRRTEMFLPPVGGVDRNVVTYVCLLYVAPTGPRTHGVFSLWPPYPPFS